MKLSQEELANKCGLTRQTINAIENNKYDPTLALAFKLIKKWVYFLSRVTLEGNFTFY
ncbi:MAG TPA: hypothetical protein DEA91_09765 [Paenibacillus sp.]|nr:hypothetical protein [Paenibacillus sp.]